MADAPDVLTIDPTRIDPTRSAGILGRTHKWARFLAIFGFISAGLMVLGGLAVGATGLVMHRYRLVPLMLVYPVMGGLMIVQWMYVLTFANRARDFASGMRQPDLEAALEAQRGYWKFLAILMIVTFAVVILFIVAATVAGAMFWMSRAR